jgi:hypothetical protein
MYWRMAKELSTDPWTIYNWPLGRWEFNFACWQAYLEEQKLSSGSFSKTAPDFLGG